MPEMYFDIRWPDGRCERCYSPSLIVKELLTAEHEYPLFEFMERTRAALNIASERVRAKYGYFCSAAIDQLRGLEEGAAEFEPSDPVAILAFHDKASAPPLVPPRAESAVHASRGAVP